MTDAEWTPVIVAGTADRPAPVKALDYLKEWPSYSKPAALSCSDGNTYVAKGRAGIERSLIAEHVVARLAPLVSAPVPPPGLIDIHELRGAEPLLNVFEDRLAHGSREISEPCSDRMHHQYGSVSMNRSRFAALCVLYSWAGCFSDHQFVYEDTSPHIVHSVDHGHFFPDGPNWTGASLQAAGGAVQDNNFDPLALQDAELKDARTSLALVSPKEIVVVAGPPDEWGIDIQLRIRLAEYLLQRKMQLSALWAAVI